MCSAVAATWFRCSRIIPKFGDIAGLQPGAVRAICRGIGPRRDPRSGEVEIRSETCAFCGGERTRPSRWWPSVTATFRRRQLVRTAIAMPNSAVCSPSAGTRLGDLPRRNLLPARIPVSHHGSGAGPARYRAHLRRWQYRTHPAWRPIHQLDPCALPPGDGGQAHHAPGEERKAESPRSRPSRMWRTSSSLQVAGALSIWRRNSAFPPSAWPRFDQRYSPGYRRGHRRAA